MYLRNYEDIIVPIVNGWFENIFDAYLEGIEESRLTLPRKTEEEALMSYAQEITDEIDGVSDQEVGKILVWILWEKRSYQKRQAKSFSKFEYSTDV